jgi:hypothetical protein
MDVVLPKVVVMSIGAPRITTFASSKVTGIGKSQKLQPDNVFSGLVNKFSSLDI